MSVLTASTGQKLECHGLSCYAECDSISKFTSVFGNEGLSQVFSHFLATTTSSYGGLWSSGL